MKDMKKSIAFLQENLNRLLGEEEVAGCEIPGAYSLSIMLDKEIVEYYKNLDQATV